MRRSPHRGLRRPRLRSGHLRLQSHNDVYDDKHHVDDLDYDNDPARSDHDDHHYHCAASPDHDHHGTGLR